MNERSIFMEALARESRAERSAYLAEACDGDTALLQRVEALLRSNEQAGNFMAKPVAERLAEQQAMPAVGEATSGSHTDTEPENRERPGTVVGPYRLLEQIGEGGFGIVFLAEQTEPVRRKVALKILKPGMDTRQVVARFEAERQALAIMDHPNIAKVFDGGMTGAEPDASARGASSFAYASGSAGRPYFVMELVKGAPITEFCDEQKLSPRQRLELFLPVCQAVQHAHQKGIIHRDLKPSNVLVSRHDTTPVVKVIDFGVAKALGQELTDKTLFTGIAQMIGTPLYMSPEQAGMSDLDIDTRSDIYSLGVLLYELLTGTTPFARERFKKAAYDEIRRIIREEEPPRPSTRLSTIEELPSIAARRGLEPKKLSGMVRGELDWIVMKALEKDRDRRYESANALALDVQRYLSDEAVQACPPSRGYRLRKFVRRNKGPVAAGMALATLLVLGTVGTSVGLAWALQAERAASASAATESEQRLKAEAAEKLAVAEKTRANEVAAITKAVNDFLQNDLLMQATPEKNARDKRVTVEDMLARAAGRIAGKFEGQPTVEAEIRGTIGEAYRALGNYRAAQPHLERALELRRNALGDENPDTFASIDSLAGLYQDQGDFPKAEALYVEALAGRRRVLGDEHSDSLASMNNLARLYQAQGQLARAERLFVTTLAIRRRVLGDESAQTLTSMNNLAALYEAQGRFPQAQELYVVALQTSRRILGDDNPRTLTTMSNLGQVYRALKDLPKAEDLFVKALAGRRRVLGEDHPDTLISMNNLASAYWSARKLESSIPLFEEALKKHIETLGSDHPNTLLTMANLGVNYRDAGRLPEGIDLLERAWDMGQKRPGPLAEVLGWIPAALAATYEQVGQFAKAEPLLRAALETTRKHHGQESLSAANALVSLGQNLVSQKKYAAAEPVRRECLAIYKKLVPDAWITFYASYLVGASLLDQGKYAECEPFLLQGYKGMKERENKLPPIGKKGLADTVERLVQLYDAWHKPETASAWRKKKSEAANKK
jgi:serine/threonine protein kinase/tetratricopeptide (TPR) repeat protein